MVTSSVWGNMATYFRGLLGVDGCIQVFDGDKQCMGEHGYIFLGTPWDGWLYSNVWRCDDMAAAFVFPLFAYHIQFHLVRFVLLNISPLVGKVVRFVLLNISPLVDSVVRFVLLNISPLVGSVVGFVLHLKPV